MRIFGSFSELIQLVFRKNSQAVTVRPNQSTTYTASRDFQLPPGDSDQVIVSATSTQTLTNKTLTSPAITTPTGIVKADVGLGNVDNTSDATKDAAATSLTNKTIGSTNNLTGATASSFTNTGTVTLFTASDTVVGKATTDVLTNKDIDGATASNTSRITLPKAATGTLSGLTRKQGTVMYDTTLGVPVYDTGSAVVALATSATSQDSILNANNYSIACSVGSSALTIALKNKAGSDPSSGDPVSIAFREATATAGSYSVVSVTAATSLVISSGSTLGHLSNVEGTIYVYALNNAGTLELAASTALFDDGSLQSTTAEGGAGAADSSTTLYSTTARTSKAIKLIARLKSTQTTAGTWAAVPTEVTIGTRILGIPTSMVFSNTGNGHGSSSTTVRRFTNNTTIGTAITYADSATLGATYTINEAGIYGISYVDRRSGGQPYFGITLNSTQLTTAIDGITTTNVLAETANASAGSRLTAAVTARLAIGDIIRPQTDGNTDDGSHAKFIITQIVKY